MTDNNAKRGRGRPKGSKNKAKNLVRTRKNNGSIADIIRKGLLAAKTPEQIITAVKKAFPDAKTSTATIHNLSLIHI